MKSVRTLLRFTATGVVLGLLMGWFLSLMSGGIFVVLFIGSIGLLLGLILGFVHWNDS